MSGLILAGYDVVFQEVPAEVSLALNLAGCPHCCPGCHSPQLQTQAGDRLTEGLFLDLIGRYRSAVTCVCFMGGDAELAELAHLARLGRSMGLKTAWYSGLADYPADFPADLFDYLKLGPYRDELGGLDRPTTNQRFYATRDGAWEDRTDQFWKKK